MSEYLDKLEAKVKLGLPLTDKEKHDYILSKQPVSTNPCDYCKRQEYSTCYGCQYAE